MEAPAIGQRMTLSDQLTVLHSPSSNLRDLLKFRDDDTASSSRGRCGPTVTLATVLPSPSSNLRDLLNFRDDVGAASSRGRCGPTVTLATVLEAEKNAASTSSSSSSSAGTAGGRTLLDVIREEESRDGGGGGGSTSRWRDLTDRLQIRPEATWTAGSESTSARDRFNSPSGADRSGSGAIRVSLMTLMELREREDEGEEGRGRAEVMAVAEVDDAEVVAAEAAGDVEDEEIWGRERLVCCVCMVRRKGAAFIPCGHTFCRVCSRELLMGRGNCPLCNASILEVLDIF